MLSFISKVQFCVVGWWGFGVVLFGYVDFLEQG